MCKLQFSSAPAHPAERQDGGLDAYAEEGALAALLALAQTETDVNFDLADNLTSSLHGVQQGSAMADGSAGSKQDSSRYHCPFPNCKRSFCELWRLKVHYRCGVEGVRGLGGVDGCWCFMCRHASASKHTRTCPKRVWC